VLSVLTAVRDIGRLREITTVLVRHGFGELVTRAFGGKKEEIASDELEKGEDEKKRISTPERVRLVLQDLGPSFIKLGQIASTRPDLIPADIVTELKKLQENVPPVPFEEVKKVVETSLGAPIEQLFVSFDEKPLATASIGQVHRAVLETPEGNKDVVVKVQRPNVGNTVARDLELLHIMAAALERAIPETKLYSPIGLVQQFDRSITAELNFTLEGENSERFTRNFEGSDLEHACRFPKNYKHVSSKQVLVLEFFDGFKIDKAQYNGFDGPTIAKKSLGIIVKMVFEDGYFHADPHPGNIIIMGTKEEPIVGLIDLGMVGRMSPEIRDRTVDLMVAAVRKDGPGVADCLYQIGRPTKKIDMREYRAEVTVLAEKYIGRPLKEIDISAMLRDLVQGAMKYGLEIPTDFMLVGKALMTIESIGKQLYPDLDVFTEAQPQFFKILRLRYSPQRIGNELIRGVEQISRAGYDVPLQAREVLEDLRLGRLQVKTVDPTLSLAADRLGRRVLTGLVVSASTVGGALTFAHNSTLGSVLLGIAGTILVFHVLLDLRRGPKPLA
jgi:ubiquinone biosynthesis protein